MSQKVTKITDCKFCSLFKEYLLINCDFFAIRINNYFFAFCKFARQKFICKHIFKLTLYNSAKRSCTIHIVKSCFCKMRNSGICYMCYTKTLVKSDIYIKKTRGDRTCEHEHSPLVFLFFAKINFHNCSFALSSAVKRNFCLLSVKSCM